MTKKKQLAIALGLVAVVALVAVMLIPQVEFIVGGGLVNLGYRLQDRLGKYDLEHDDSITPGEIWDELLTQNDLAADVRDVFPRTVRHPVVAVLACMDARIDTSELVGDTRRYYYIVRTAGSVLAPPEQEMLELAVLNGVKVLLLTSHSDCAAEAAASNPESREKFPALTELMDARVNHVKEFMERPVIREAIEKGELEIKLARIDTDSDRLVVGDIVSTFPAPSISDEAGHDGH
jgi:carbonic anhydrase